MSKKLTNEELRILAAIGPIRYGNSIGRPSNRKRALIAQLIAIAEYERRKQIKKEPK